MDLIENHFVFLEEKYHIFMCLFLKCFLFFPNINYMAEGMISQAGTLKSAMNSVCFYVKLVLDFLLDLVESIGTTFSEMSNQNPSVIPL